MSQSLVKNLLILLVTITISTSFCTHYANCKLIAHETNNGDGNFSRLLFQVSARSSKKSANVIVAIDGSGDYTRIMDAVNDAPDYSERHYVIYVKKGKYHEHVTIGSTKTNIVIVGDGIDKTIISGNRNQIDGSSLSDSATFDAEGKRLVARDLTIENTAGPANRQAVALRSDADLAAFYHVAIRGYQDTLLVNRNRQFFKKCIISGTIDFIFGHAQAIFQDCKIEVRKGLPHQISVITAHGGLYNGVPGGFIFWSCKILPSEELENDSGFTTFLGRPWKAYSRTMFIKSYMSGIINPQGWLAWNGNQNLDTLYYGEYKNYGPGADTSNRVKWAGYHKNIPSSEAGKFTVSRFINGDMWLPSTEIPGDGA